MHLQRFKLTFWKKWVRKCLASLSPVLCCGLQHQTSRQRGSFGASHGTWPVFPCRCHMVGAEELLAHWPIHVSSEMMPKHMEFSEQEDLQVHIILFHGGPKVAVAQRDEGGRGISHQQHRFPGAHTPSSRFCAAAFASAAPLTGLWDVWFGNSPAALGFSRLRFKIKQWASKLRSTAR